MSLKCYIVKTSNGAFWQAFRIVAEDAREAATIAETESAKALPEERRMAALVGSDEPERYAVYSIEEIPRKVNKRVRFLDAGSEGL
jgi:NRPS condensation-like uncharacterized protein